jgi:predicted O-methyltransferase YrrM
VKAVERLRPGGKLIEALRSSLGGVRARRADGRGFRMIGTIPCECGHLVRGVASGRIARALRADDLDLEWRRVHEEMLSVGIAGERPDAVNPGDRRAIYYLVRHFRPRAVLEIGTHIGASTLHIAAALREGEGADPSSSHVTTVDIVDVNDPHSKPWVKYGAEYSPLEMAQRLGLDRRVTFVESGSLDYLSSSAEHYDFIFLDGDHAARTVYQELPAALKLLGGEGVILLHDYFPNLQPLWHGGNVIRGPWLATERLRSEGADFTVVPLGDLPWPTKLDSCTTSLALVVGR